MAALIAATGIIGFASAVGLYAEAESKPNRGAGGSAILDGRAEAAFQAAFERAVPFRDAAVAALAAVRYDLFAEGYPGVLVGGGGWLFSSEEFDADIGFLDGDFGELAARTRDALAARGIALVVAVVPSKARIMAGRLGRYRLPESLQGRYAKLAAALEALSVPVVDLDVALSSAATAGVEPFLRTDTHWSPEGAEAAARAAAGVALAAVPDLERAEVDTDRAGEAERDGDLLSFLPARGASIRALPPPDRLAAFETSAETGAGLFGAQTIPVALVGTSYSAEPAFHFEGFLKQALGADVLNLSSKGEGPFAPMERALSGSTLEDSGVRIVIWEIPERYVPIGSILGG